MDLIISLNSNLEYLALIFLVVATLNAFWGLISKRSFGIKDLRLSLFTLIFSYIQMLMGITSYFVSNYFFAWENGVGAVIRDSNLRIYLIQRPITNILAIVLITMGWSLHKKASVDRKKYFRIAVFYAIGLLLLFNRVSWQNWS
tara:strand:- start:163 stop:594 length:432 start_codon:yes stop_codon:yes gene_type:complete